MALLAPGACVIASLGRHSAQQTRKGLGSRRTAIISVENGFHTVRNTPCISRLLKLPPRPVSLCYCSSEMSVSLVRKRLRSAWQEHFNQGTMNQDAQRRTWHRRSLSEQDSHPEKALSRGSTRTPQNSPDKTPRTIRIAGAF